MLLPRSMMYDTIFVTTGQSKLPKNAKPLFLIIYADKSRLSSFGTAKGYSVIARLANLPDFFRNGEGIGGGEIVGWLPIVCI